MNGNLYINILFGKYLQDESRFQFKYLSTEAELNTRNIDDTELNDVNDLVDECFVHLRLIMIVLVKVLGAPSYKLSVSTVGSNNNIFLLNH